MAFVEFHDVKKVYQMGQVRIEALRDVNFEVEKGEFCVVVGASGAGKTTILNILGGMDTLSEGSVWLDGKEISSYNKRQLTESRRFDIGFVFQFYNLAISEEWSFALSAGKDKSSCSFCLSAHFGYCIVRECDHRYLNVDAGHR